MTDLRHLVSGLILRAKRSSERSGPPSASGLPSEAVCLFRPTSERSDRPSAAVVRGHAVAGRLLLLFMLLSAVAVATEVAFFLKMTLSKPALKKADLIAVFTGEGGRVEQGYRLANQSYGSHLVITSASPQVVEYYRKKLNGSTSIDQILEINARTTVENAIHTKEIMLERGMRSVILVTSWDHIPRAYFLLRLLFLGHDVKIRFCSVPTGRLDTRNWYFSSEGWKRIYNEAIGFWGSLLELAKFRLTGIVPHELPNHSPLIDSLRKALLFDLTPARRAVGHKSISGATPG